MLEVALPILFSILAVLALILVNAAWVAAEFAIVRVRRTRLEELAGQGVEEARHAIVVVDGIGDYLALTQIGITIASLAVGWLAEGLVLDEYRDRHLRRQHGSDRLLRRSAPASKIILSGVLTRHVPAALRIFSLVWSLKSCERRVQLLPILKLAPLYRPCDRA
jgi:CBS domain containing-hemolysin-like protein